MELEGTHETPRVYVGDNRIEIEGVCMPENAFEFFESIHQEVATVVATAQSLEVKIRLSYLNSTSNKHLLKILKAIESSHPKTIISWHFNAGDRLMEMKGNEMKKFCPGLAFDILPQD